MVWSSYPLWPRTLQKVRSLCWMLMAEDGRQQLSWFHFLVWQMAETCLTPPYGHPHCCRVSSAKTYCPKKRCSATCTVQRCVSCSPPALWHTPQCCPTTASVTPYCGDQKDLSQSRQIELWLCRCQLRCKVTSDRLKAPSSKSECSEWTLSLSRTVGCFWRIGYNSWL